MVPGSPTGWIAEGRVMQSSTDVLGMIIDGS